MVDQVSNREFANLWRLLAESLAQKHLGIVAGSIGRNSLLLMSSLAWELALATENEKLSEEENERWAYALIFAILALKKRGLEVETEKTLILQIMRHMEVR